MSLIKLLEKKPKEELIILAKKLSITNSRNTKKEELIEKILRGDEKFIRRELGLSWWKNQHAHVYGLVTIVAAISAVIFYIFPYAYVVKNFKEFTLDGAEQELMINGDFSEYYKPAWSEVKNSRKATISTINEFMNIEYTGKGASSRAVELFQEVDLHNRKTLLFSMRLRISDLEGEGFPVAELAFISGENKTVFRMIFTPDEHFIAKEIDYVYRVANGKLETVKLYPIEYARRTVPIENYLAITKAKVSFYIKVPGEYRCKKCLIEVQEVSLKNDGDFDD